MRKSSNKKKSSKKNSTSALRRRRLERATTAYFASLSGEELREEQALGRVLAYEASKVDFDQ
jgi:hypothetical protein